MSILDLLDNDAIWNNFLETKESSNNLPQKVIYKYQEFINDKKYVDIAKEIINAKYKFSIPKKVLISKMGKNKKRAVYIYKETEIYILKLLSNLLYKYDDMFSPNLYSFRKNSGVKKAVNTITKTKSINKMYVYKVDISNYFNSIPVKNLLKNLKVDLKDDKLYKLIKGILLNKKVRYDDKIIKEEKKGIMAGVPISAFLANYYLKDLDKYFYINNILYARYADDIIVFGNSKTEIEHYQSIIKKVIKDKGLYINKGKEFFYSPGDKFEFLGFSFKKGVIDINDASFKKIKGKIRRTARGLRRWMLRKNAKREVTLKAMNRKYNNKFFGKSENDLTWKYWFFPIINTDNTLKQIDKYMQEEQRYLLTGVHNKRNFEKVPYEFLKKCNYKSLVNEYHKFKK